jgi:hypothetical protein
VYARSTTIQARPASIDAGVRHIRDTVLPALNGIDGFTGLSCMCDRESGRCIVTTAWSSEDTLRASTQPVRPIRDRAAEMFGASDTQVDELEIAVLHRDHRAGDGACVRAVWTRTDPANVDRAIDAFKMNTLPVIEQQPGFCSASLMVNRSTGLGVASVAYDSVDSMRQTRQETEELRNRVMQQAGIELLDVHEFELALAQLHVPETV